MLIFRYIVKEVLTTVAATTIVLLLIFLSTQFVHYLSGAAIGRFTASVLFHIMALQIPYLLGLLMPLGLYLALLLAYGRLYADREMTVLSCFGVSQSRFLAMTMIMSVFVMIIVAILTCWLSPYVAFAQKRLISEAKAAPLVETILPGRFFSMDKGKRVLYVENVSRDHKMLNNIFVAEQSGKGKKGWVNNWSVASANSGYQIADPNDDVKRLVINDGHRYIGKPGFGNFQVQSFGTLEYIMNQPRFYLKKQASTISTLELFRDKTKNLAYEAELQWRLSMPLSVLILSLLAFQLSKVNPRQGKYAQLIPAILIYIIYANMMFVGRDWIQSGAVDPSIGLWWLHGLLLILGLSIMFWRSHYSIPIIKAVTRRKIK